MWRVWASEAQFLGPKVPKEIPVFGFFRKQNFHCFRISLRLHVNFEGVCWISASGAQLPGHFRPRNRSPFRSSVIFSNISHWFHVILVLYVYWGVLWGYRPLTIPRPMSVCARVCARMHACKGLLLLVVHRNIFILVYKVSRLRLYKMIVLKYYVENKALFETWIYGKRK